jgi:hypothetical protein
MYAGLTVLAWLFMATGALLALLTAVQALRGDADARPMVTILSALLFIGLALAARWGARRAVPPAE